MDVTVMKRILILNGAARKNGSTSGLIHAFREGAESSGNSVNELYLYDMDISDCRGCLACERKGITDEPNPCSIKDDMVQVYEEFRKADVIVFASPIYYWSITGKLKTTVDRLFAMIGALGMDGYRKSSVLLSTAAGSNYTLATEWHQNFNRVTGWTILGNVLGADKTDEARKLGASIK